MNNETKEVLDFKENADYKRLSCDEIAILRDYITNLDEKNKELKKKITFNEKSRRKMQQSLMEQIEDYKSRIDKATAYIKNTCCIQPNEECNIDLRYDEVDYLLNILRGEGNEDTNR